MIVVDCPHCRASLRVKDELAGRRGKCPKCQAVVIVPRRRPAADRVAERQPEAATASVTAAPQPLAAAHARQPPPAADRSEVLRQLGGHIAPVPTSLGYKGAVLLVAVVMLLLPVVYVAIIAGVALLLYLHVVTNTWLFADSNGGGGRAGLYALLAYLAPLVAGGILLFFMCKPLFARAGRREKPRSLTRQGEPLLFAFVDRLCAVVGAPAPTRIDVDCQVNASASFRRGLVSMLGKDMVLTLGLPLVAGLNLQQFAGVLAHEFGHFAQGWGLRLAYVIRVISHWFTRVVYERDAWDEWLADSARNWDFRVGIILHFSRLLVWLTRKVLWALMMIGHGVAGLLLRQMEFDADLHEIRFSGSESFEATCRKLTELNVANSIAFNDLQAWYRESRLSDNLPLLIRSKADGLPGELRLELNRHIDNSTAGWLDTHPADSQRIAQARSAQEAGLFHDARPAVELFSDFHALSKTVTFDLYKALLGNAVKITDMHSTEELIERQERENLAGAALERYLLGRFHPLRPLPFGTGWIDGAADSAQTADRVRSARDQMVAQSPEYATSLAELLECDATVAMCAKPTRYWMQASRSSRRHFRNHLPASRKFATRARGHSTARRGVPRPARRLRLKRPNACWLRSRAFATRPSPHGYPVERR